MFNELDVMHHRAHRLHQFLDILVVARDTDGEEANSIRLRLFNEKIADILAYFGNTIFLIHFIVREVIDDERKVLRVHWTKRIHNLRHYRGVKVSKIGTSLDMYYL